VKEKPLENCEYNMTYAEIGKELGISRESVREIQARALRKIAHRLRGYKGYEKLDGDVRLTLDHPAGYRGDSW
jgi:predicted DNA-binding protein (UPF0251 family)